MLWASSRHVSASAVLVLLLARPIYPFSMPPHSLRRREKPYLETTGSSNSMKRIRWVAVHCQSSTGGAVPSATVPVPSTDSSSSPVAASSLDSLQFDNRNLRCLPVDRTNVQGIRQVPGACFATVDPTPVERPRLVAASADALRTIGVDYREDNAETEAALAEYFSGNVKLGGSETAAHCYCGHQFGAWAGQLGDGAAIYLGEVVNEQGDRVEIQLKGAGLTPFSRMADGRKVLRSSVREFLCSEAMHALGIPTTRAGTLVTSDTVVYRDPVYDGTIVEEKASIVLRMASTFLRFGSFEIFKAPNEMGVRSGPSYGRPDIKTALLNYVIRAFYPELLEAHGIDTTTAGIPAWQEGVSPTALPTEVYRAFYAELLRRTARLVALWQCVGWVHGVLNTDNMSIVGDTIDYGPFGFVEFFCPTHVSNGSDDRGYYCYRRQPDAVKFNMRKLAEALAPLLPLEESFAELEKFDEIHHDAYMQQMRRKLGLIRTEKEEDAALVADLLETMQATAADFTVTFRAMSDVTLTAGSIHPSSDDLSPTFQEAEANILRRLGGLVELRRTLRPAMDPSRVQMVAGMLRQGVTLEQMGMDQDTWQQWLGAYKEYEKVIGLTASEKEARDKELWRVWLTKYARRLQKDAEGLDKDALSQWEADRRALQNRSNPKAVLRNHMAQRAIEEAERGEYGEVRRLVGVLSRPYDDDHEERDCLPAVDTKPLVVTCSS
ncbi:unnamed protein product [Vitrella brassicaformis CCMP3155]|uniref:Selenoprotein O n=3 Tax=Vitrella brassicaformis TaxID=1169539 RepID=A0A0G4H1H5_VITBC|nr:unnamed protein product [Vitrella brassicaformis CCMP3155]|eukprot:CEM37451.1 unnamed protein product [Vitrella brassicaformis CCMP3155]